MRTGNNGFAGPRQRPLFLALLGTTMTDNLLDQRPHDGVEMTGYGLTSWKSSD
jgi:hypothetical protein